MKLRRLAVIALFLALIAPVSVAAVPSLPTNFDRGSSKLITSLPYQDTSDNTLALQAPLVMEAGCGAGELWYRYRDSETRKVEVTARGAGFPASLSLFTNYGRQECASQDSYGEDPATLTFSLHADVDYYFVIGSRSVLARGLVTISASEVPPGPAPVHDERSQAVGVSALPFEHIFDNSSATLSKDDPAACGVDKDVWYTYTPTADEEVIVDTWLDGAILVVYETSSYPKYLACDDGASYQARLRMTLTAAKSYLFRVGSVSGGPARFSIQRVDDVMSVENDSHLNPRVATSLPFSHRQSNEAASVEEGEARYCARTSKTVWFSYTPSADHAARATVSAEFDAVVSIYESSDVTHHLSCADGYVGPSTVVDFSAFAGNTYLIQVGGAYGGFGDLEFNLTDQGSIAAPSFVDPEDALIRPGIRVDLVSTSCSSNFVFEGTGLRRGRIYIGTAAHCVERDMGSSVSLPTSDSSYYTGDGPGPAIGTVVYSSSDYNGDLTVPCPPFSCSSGEEESMNDFALIEINASYRDKVSPSLLHFGGPTGVVEFEEVQPGQKAMSFGASPLRPGPEQLDWHEGYVTEKRPKYEIGVKFLTMGIPGDSGSATIRGDGSALGVLVTLSLGGEGGRAPTSNGVASLSKLLDYASGLGWQLNLSTSPTLDRGVLPSLSS